MSMKRCPFCGAPNPPDATFCVNCGAKLPSDQPQPYTAPPPPQPAPSTTMPSSQPTPYSRPMDNTQPQTSPPAPPPPPAPPVQQPYQVGPPRPIILKEKDAGIAAVLSLIIPGLGQMYVGKVGRGIIILLITIVLSVVLIGFIIWIWNIFDAYNLAKKYNEALKTTGTKPW